MGVGLFLLAMSTLLGGVLGLILNKRHFGNIKLLIAFTGGFLFSTTITHLLPEVFDCSHNQNIAIFVLIGFFFQFILEKFSEGIEHGHLHTAAPHGHDHQHNHDHYHTESLTTSIGLWVSLSIHMIIEGIPLNGAFGLHDGIANNNLFWSVLLHHMPTAFALSMVLTQTRLSHKAIVGFLLSLACMTPIGVLIGHFLLEQQTQGLEHLFHILTAIATGTFLHIATTIIFEASDNHQLNLKRALAAFLGALFVLIL